MNVPLTPVRFLRYAEQQYPGKTAVVCGRERFTYSQFAERAGRLAGALRSIGIEPGDRVAFLSMNCHRLLEAYFGVLEAGAVLLPLNIRLAPDELVYILNDAEAKVLFLEKDFSGFVDGLRQNFPVCRPSRCLLAHRRPVGSFRRIMRTCWLPPLLIART